MIVVSLTIELSSSSYVETSMLSRRREGVEGAAAVGGINFESKRRRMVVGFMVCVRCAAEAGSPPDRAGRG